MDFAVIDVSGRQYRVQEHDELEVPKLESDVGDSVVFDRVLLLQKGGKTFVGAPTVKKAAVTGTVLLHGREKKVLVFKKKRRKGYKRIRGHRQDYSVVTIDSISA